MGLGARDDNGCDIGAGEANRERSLDDTGASTGRTVPELPSGAQPGGIVGVGNQPNTVGHAGEGVQCGRRALDSSGR